MLPPRIAFSTARQTAGRLTDAGHCPPGRGELVRDLGGGRRPENGCPVRAHRIRPLREATRIKAAGSGPDCRGLRCRQRHNNPSGSVEAPNVSSAVCLFMADTVVGVPMMGIPKGDQSRRTIKSTWTCSSGGILQAVDLCRITCRSLLTSWRSKREFRKISERMSASVSRCLSRTRE